MIGNLRCYDGFTQKALELGLKKSVCVGIWEDGTHKLIEVWDKKEIKDILYFKGVYNA